MSCSETRLGETTNATALLSGIRHATIFRTLLNEDFITNMVKLSSANPRGVLITLC